MVQGQLVTFFYYKPEPRLESTPKSHGCLFTTLRLEILWVTKAGRKEKLAMNALLFV